ncbi:MAG: hypothetical protein IJ569_07705 [Prevotella sp.]|nr:hypothetical protein [Prevotella sp.]
MGNEIETELFTTAKTYKTGGCVKIMLGVDKSKPDYKPILTLATLFAMEGKTAKILTSCHFKSEEYKTVFGALMGTKYERKCPDLLIDGKFYEYEGFEKPWKKEKVRRMVSHGMKQSSRMIINNTKGASDRYIRQAIIARINVGATIKEVWIYEKGQKRLFFKDGQFY